jgi:hypothetical protein
MNPPTELIDDLQLVDPPEPFNWWYLAGALVAIVLLVIVLRWHVRTRLVRLQAAKLRRAWVDALKELEKLFALIDREESRPYALESSAIIRHYIEDRFELSAPRQSTEEFLESAQHSPKLEPRHQESLGEFLSICDLLKFAQTLADKTELMKLHDAAVAFVMETRPQKPEEEET